MNAEKRNSDDDEFRSKRLCNEIGASVRIEVLERFRPLSMNAPAAYAREPTIDDRLNAIVLASLLDLWLKSMFKEVLYGPPPVPLPPPGAHELIEIVAAKRIRSTIDVSDIANRVIEMKTA